MSDEYVTEIEAQRERKDTYFAEQQGSPIPQDAPFPGLDYFDVDPDCRFELEIEEHDEKETLSVETTADRTIEYVRWGEFTVEIDGEPVTLQAYQPAGGPDRLWVPFRDETNGEETYDAGRYIDLEPEHHRTDDGAWVLDFNQAYNPSCAYNEAYECPLIPTENWLDIRVEAGEKAYPGETIPYDPDE